MKTIKKTSSKTNKVNFVQSGNYIVLSGPVKNTFGSFHNYTTKQIN